MKDFFIDTANTPYIKNLWNSIKGEVSPSIVRGITTNPNAFFKTEEFTLDSWIKKLPELCEIVSDIRQDDKGVVYIQCPSCDMTPDQVLKYAEFISTKGDGNTKIGLKIPPYHDILKIVPQLNEMVDTNVTGVADCGTALKCLTHPIHFLSIIPGRMEEMGIDAKAHVAYLKQRGGNSEIITGSMRTVEGLEWVFQYDTVPTIGERVWNILLEDNVAMNRILNIEYNGYPVQHFAPANSQVNTDLSVAFFNQMNECGKIAHEDYLKMK
jgi:hypothetical protein